MKKIILITGGTGYIGSHGVVAFEEAGYKTVIIDNLYNSSKETLDGIEKIIGYTPDFYEVDLRDKEKLQEIFEKYDFDGVLHFAGLKSPFESQSQSILYFQNNLSGSLNLFECMEQFGVKNIVFSSSANTYCTSNIPPILEEAPQSTTNPYGTTKLLIEKILKDLSQFSSFRVVSLRYFNPIWAHSSWFLWEKIDSTPNNLLPYILKVALWEIDSVKVFWDDYDTIDGTGIRDYIDVVDLIDWHVKAYQFLEWNQQESGIFFESINLWTGKWTSVLEMIQSCESVAKKCIKYRVESRREWDIPVSFCSPKKAKNLFWWEAKTSIEESIKNSLRFYEK